VLYSDRFYQFDGAIEFLAIIRDGLIVHWSPV
jgi:hypothetical protein